MVTIEKKKKKKKRKRNDIIEIDNQYNRTIEDKNVKIEMNDKIEMNEHNNRSIEYINNDYIIVDTEELYQYNPENIENIILLDFNKYLENIVLSFRNDDDIWNQFKMDIVRSKFYINHCPINDPYIIREFLQNQLSSSLNKELMMISNQVLMGTPYELIANTILPYNWYIGELGLNSKIDKQMSINLNISSNEITIRGEKKMRIFKINNECMDETLYLVDICLEIDILNKSKILIKIINTKE